MSFDLSVTDADGDQAWSANYTSNMGAFFAWALSGVDAADPAARCDSRDAIFGKRPIDGLVSLDGLACHQALPRLRAALARIDSAEAGALDRFNAPNGWGTWPRATEVLRQLARHCDENRAGTVGVSL